MAIFGYYLGVDLVPTLSLESRFSFPRLSPDPIRSVEARTGDCVSVEHFETCFETSNVGTYAVPRGCFGLMVNRVGTLIVRPSGSLQVFVLPPNSVTFLVPKSDIIVLASKGVHDIITMCWFATQTPSIVNLVNSNERVIASQPILNHLDGAIQRLETPVCGNSALQEVSFLSAAMEVAGHLFSGPDFLQLCSVPMNLPNPLRDLVKLVYKDSAKPWPLKEAADYVGYSPFHFSRVFKQTVGTGFHEFVDRTRTAKATEMLANSELSVDEIAVSAGFGTTQGLRDSVKEYLGIVPSDIRNIPLLKA